MCCGGRGEWKERCGERRGIEAMNIRLEKYADAIAAVQQGVGIIKVLVKVFSRFVEKKILPKDQQAACIVQLVKEEWYKRELSTYSRVILLNVSGKIFGRVVEQIF